MNRLRIVLGGACVSIALSACGQPLANTPVAQLAPATSTLAPRPNAAPTATATSVAPSASKQLGNAIPARWDWRQPATAIDLPGGTGYRYRGETDTGWCRLALDNGAAPWVLCSQVDIVPPASVVAPATPALAADQPVAPPVEAVPSEPTTAAPDPDLSEDQRAQRDAQPGPAPRDLPPDVAAAPACVGPTGVPSPMCQGITNGEVERLAREAEARGDYVEAARLRNWLPR